MNYHPIQEQVYETILKLRDAGLTRLSAGNVSTRTDDGLVAITPSAVKYDVLSPADIAIVDLHGRIIQAVKKPSSETPMHTAILRNFPHIHAICHSHSPHAIAFAMLGEEVPAANIELWQCGAPVPVGPWACPGTDAAARVAVQVFSERPELKVFLLRKHGLVAVGSSLNSAFEFAYTAEIGMQAYYYACSLGKPEPLTHLQIEEIKQAYS
jgi:L-fuculose-phosphate aldolase